MLRLTCQAAAGAYADYESTSEPYHRLILDTIERLDKKGGGQRVVNCEERSLVSFILYFSLSVYVKRQNSDQRSLVTVLLATKQYIE